MIMYSYKLKKVNGKLTFCVYAHRKGVVFEFYRRNEDGKRCRNVYSNVFSGNNVRIPGFRYGYRHEVWEEENWGKVSDKLTINKYWSKITEKDIAKYEKAYPGIHYMLEKSEWNHEDVWNIIPIWKKNPKVEILIANGYNHIAYNKSFWKMKEATQKEYLQVLKKVSWKNPTLEMLRCVKNGMTEEQYYLSHSAEFYDWEKRKYVYEMDVLNYLIKKQVNVREYYDYIKMAKSLDKDVSDPYWKFPNDFHEAHMNVLEKCNHRRYVQELIKKKDDERRLAKAESRYVKAVKKYLGKTIEMDGLKVYVPEKIAEYGHQADILHQCIVENAYYEDVADKKSILVFITKNNEPYATCELLKNGKRFTMGQFYGDEQLDDYEAQPDAVNALKVWAETYKINIVS